MMKIAVLGATGPTGIHLVTELRKTVATVRVVARSMDKLVRLFPDPAVERWVADISDAGATLLAVDGCDLVYDCHIATVGHTGKDESKGERGSNAKLADVESLRSSHLAAATRAGRSMGQCGARLSIGCPSRFTDKTFWHSESARSPAGQMN